MQQPGNAPATQLGDEVAAGNALLQVLRLEQEHLIAANVDALAGVTEDKSKLVARMNELAQARYRALLGAGFEGSEAGMQAWTATASPSDGASWNDLRTIAQQARELNRVNGLLISQHMARNQAALSALQVGSQSGGTLYGPNGQSATSAGSRRLVVG